MGESFGNGTNDTDGACGCKHKKGEMDLDLALKRVLACKPILARILKGVVEECSGMDAEEVEACIEGEVSVDRVLLGPGLTNSIIGEAQEDYQNGEG